MRVLNRKALRDLWRQRAALGAIALVMGAGVATLVMAQSTILSLRATRDAYYERYRFGDVFASLKRAPDRVVEEIRTLPGVLAVDSRVVQEVNLVLDNNPDLCTGRLVSLPDQGEPILNGVHLRRGRLPAPGADDEALVSEPFAQANRLGPGDTIRAVINGRLQRLSIVGVALAPEFVYFVRAGEMLPDDRRSGALWMRRDALERALDMEGAFNDIVVRAAPDASLDRIIADIDRALDRYGGLGAYDRSEHVSDRYLRDEFQQLGVMGAVTPLVFLGVGAFLVNMVIGRLVRAQREQVATLKAFGYSNLSLSFHVAIMAPAVASVTSRSGMIESFRATIAEHITRITVLHALFGGVIAVGVVYNTARIMLTERRRELATLRVLGFTRREVASMLEREIAVVAVLGAALGLLLGRALAWGLVQALQTESYVFPLVINSSTYASAAAITLASAGVSLWIVRRGVARLDLLASLKSIAT